MVRLRALTLLLLVLGVLELTLAALMIPASILGALDDPGFGAFAACSALLAFVAGAMHVLGGVLCHARKARPVVFASLFTGLLTLPSCYCVGPAVAVLVIGLVFLLDDEVVRLYEGS